MYIYIFEHKNKLQKNIQQIVIIDYNTLFQHNSMTKTLDHNCIILYLCGIKIKQQKYVMFLEWVFYAYNLYNFQLLKSMYDTRLMEITANLYI